MTPQRRWATTVGLALTFGLVCSLPASGWAGKRWVNEATGESRSGLYCKIHEEFVPSIAECPGHIAKLANNAGKEMLRPYECPMAHGPGTCHGMNPDYDLSFCLWGKPPAEWDQVAGAEMGPPRAGRDALLSQASQMLGGGASMSLSEQEAWNALNREDGLAPDWDHPSDDCASLRTTLDGRLASDQGLVDEVEKAAPGLDTATSSCSLVAGVLRADRDPCVAFKSPVQHTVTKEFEEEVTVQVTLQRERRSSNFLVGLFGGTETVEHTVNRKQKVTYKKPVREDAPWGKWHAICPEVSASTANAGAADALENLLAAADAEQEPSEAAQRAIEGWEGGASNYGASNYGAFDDLAKTVGAGAESELSAMFEELGKLWPAPEPGKLPSLEGFEHRERRTRELAAEVYRKTGDGRLALALCTACGRMESNELGWKEVETLRSGVSTFLDTADWSDPKTTGNEAIVPADVAGKSTTEVFFATFSRARALLGPAESSPGAEEGPAQKTLEALALAVIALHDHNDVFHNESRQAGVARERVIAERAAELGFSKKDYEAALQAYERDEKEAVEFLRTLIEVDGR